ncbi:MAG: ABC transporter ATP-binding protein [Bacteroidetes bacterium]|nr:ABC transporter ATP-binding protein [Bacteroidota bacterium]
MITVNNLTKIYNGVCVLNINNLNIAKGESFGLVGNNGAGKTTFFRLILDLIRANGGEVFSQGMNVKGNEAWKQYTGSYLDEAFLIDFLTAEEYFNFIGKLHNMSKGDISAFLSEYADFFNEEILGQKKYIRDFSKGNQKKIGIIAALMGNPEVLVLDEPFTNLDPSSQIRLKRILHELKAKQEVTMLISSHDLMHVTEVCERIVVLEKGLIVHDLITNENTLKQLESYFAV